MLSQDDRFRVNDVECAAKVIDGEAVIINLLNGTYYGLEQAGCTIWELLAGQHSLAETVSGVVTAYDVPVDVARADVSRLLQELVVERILLRAEADAKPVTAGNTDRTPATGVAYVTPALTTYRDMADLLALDPPMPRLEDIVWSDNVDSKS